MASLQGWKRQDDTLRVGDTAYFMPFMLQFEHGSCLCIEQGPAQYLSYSEKRKEQVKNSKKLQILSKQIRLTRSRQRLRVLNPIVILIVCLFPFLIGKKKVPLPIRCGLLTSSFRKVCPRSDSSSECINAILAVSHSLSMSRLSMLYELFKYMRKLR